MRLVSSVSAVCLSALASVMPAQEVSGTARGLDGRASAGITLRAVDANGRLLVEAVSADDGGFVLRAPGPVHAVVARCEAVQLEIRVPDGKASDLAVTFAGVDHFAIVGRLLDPGGSIARGIDIAARDAAGKALALVTTDADGRFVVHANRPVHDLLVDPLGWAHRVTGPLPKNTELPIDLQQHRDAFFRLHGRTFDASGTPASGVRVIANDGPRPVANTISDADGTFTVWVNRTITHLFGQDGMPTTARTGPWRDDATVDLDERVHGYQLVRGRVLGNAVNRTAIYGATARPKPPHAVAPDGVTLASGVFALRVPRYQTHLWFFQESGNREAWIPIVAGQDLEVRLAP